MARIFDPSFRLRDHHVAPELPLDEHKGLGLAALHEPELKLADYFSVQGVNLPAAVSRPHPSFQWGMLANDAIGDCVIAGMLHSIEDFHLDAGTPVPAFTDEDAVSVYSAITGYNPADPSTDRGTDPSQAMRYWQSPGIGAEGEHKIVGSLAVNPQVLDECRIAIDEFVDLQLAVALPLSAQGQSEWAVVGDPATDENSKPGSWGGHGIPAREYDGETFKVVTWGAELLVTVPFWLAYVVEAYVVVTEEMLNKSGVGPSGVNWDKLVADFHALTPAS